MYVCICKGITTKQIEEVVKECTTLSEVIEKTTACTNCGRCKDELKQVFKQSLIKTQTCL